MIVRIPLNSSGRVSTLALTLLFPAQAAPPADRSAQPSDRDVWEIAQHELRFVNELPAPPRKFNVGIYVQFLGSGSEVVNDYWNVAWVSMGPAGPSVVALPLPPFLQLPTGATAGAAERSRSKARGKTNAPSPVPDSPIRMDGFVYMLLCPDIAGIGPDRYFFEFAGNESLGGLQTSIFRLKPKPSAGPGGFAGQIWVAGYDVVRFKGAFVNPSAVQPGGYLSFDTVRYKASNGHYVPWVTYLDQSGLPPHTPGSRALRAWITAWHLGDVAERLGTIGIQVDNAKTPAQAPTAPLSSEDARLESEQDFIHWLSAMGLVATRGDFENEVCDPIIQDILAANHIVLDRPLSCRILLTTPAETVLWEGIIGVSYSTFDLIPNTATMAVLLAREVALAKLGGTHLDIGWGNPANQSDPLERLKVIHIAPRQALRDEADALAIRYVDGLLRYRPDGKPRYPPEDLEAARIFLSTAAEACKNVPALLAPALGDGLPGY